MRSLRSGLFSHSSLSLCPPNMQALRSPKMQTLHSTRVPLAFPPAFPLPSPLPLPAFLPAFLEDRRSGNTRSENN